MSNHYKTQSTSKSSAVVDDKILSETSLTRKVIRPMIVDNPKNSDASVKITVLHQKAIKKNEFEDISEQPLTSLKAKEIVKLSLDSAETKKLYDELGNLYQIHKKDGVPRGENNLIVANADEVIVTDRNKAVIIKKLIDQNHSEDVWKQLITSNPDLATKLSLARLQQSRSQSLEIFKEMLIQNLPETKWQMFFEQNTWIFGYGLNFQILKTVTSQPHLGGQTIDGKGTSKGDFLKSTQGDSKFTVLVEIKKPSTDLLNKAPYRNDSYSPSAELNGGMGQLRSNARKWEHEESRSDKNRDILDKAGIYTIVPKLILVIGNTNQLTDRAKRESFELFRRGQNDVEVITFDEVHERAKFIVEHNEEHLPEKQDEDCPF